MVGSDLLIYIPWAVWNLPIWILQHFFGIDAAYNVGSLLWSKLFLAVVFALCIIPIKRIAKDAEDVSKILFLSFTSFFTIMSVCFAGQNDSLVIFAFLMAIAGLKEGKTKSFIVWSALSIAFKPFFIFSYIAVILLREKNLLKILGYVAAGFSLYVLQKVPFIGAPMYKESLAYGPTVGVLENLLSSKLDIPPAGASFFVLALGAFYLMAYFTDKTEEESRFKEYIYYITAPLILFFAFANYEAYRPVYLVPIFIILMTAKKELYRTNLLLETVSTSALIAYYILDDPLFYNPNNILWGHKSGPLPSISLFLTSKMPGYGFTAFTAVYVVCMVFFLLINHPGFNRSNRVLCMKEEPWLLTVRSLIYAIPLLISLALRFL